MYFYVYMLLCSDGSVYVGHTDNLEERLSKHRNGTYCGYTAKRVPVRLFFSDWFHTRDEAFAAEHKIKKWTRAKKLALARGDIALLKHLARRRTPVASPNALFRSWIRVPHHERKGVLAAPNDCGKHPDPLILRSPPQAGVTKGPLILRSPQYGVAGRRASRRTSGER